MKSSVFSHIRPRVSRTGNYIPTIGLLLPFKKYPYNETLKKKMRLSPCNRSKIADGLRVLLKFIDIPVFVKIEQQ
jgi:hypothetical protein